MPVRRNYLDVQNDGKIRLENNTPITNFRSTGIVSNLLSSLSVETENIYNEIEYLYSIFDPTKSVGRELDNIGFIFGVDRNQSTTASDLSTTNFRFYLDPRLGLSLSSLINQLYPINTHYNRRKDLEEQGYIDDAGSPTYLLIPAGTTVSNVDTTVNYRTVNDVYIRNGSTEGYTAIIANAAGPAYNVGANTLVKHSLNIISSLKDLSKYIMCSNRYPIGTGSLTEGDSDFRYKLSLSRSALGSNEPAIRRQLLTIPGIRDLSFERGRYGNGTTNILVEGINPLVSEGLLEVIRERVQQLLPGGETVFVERPEYRGVEINFELLVDPGSDRNILREQTRRSVISFINDVPIGGTIIWNQLAALIVESPGVQDFILNYYKVGDYDPFHKINKNQVVLRPVNQRSTRDQKFYTDAGLVSICCR